MFASLVELIDFDLSREIDIDIDIHISLRR